MNTFVLDTESVSSTKTTLDTLTNSIKNLADQVNGYDTSCSEFDFNTPKQVIANNLEACKIKVQNTCTYMETVLSSHTSLQNTLKFDNKIKEALEAEEEYAETGTSVSGGNTGYSGSVGYSGGYSGGYSAQSYTSYQAPQVKVVNASISNITHGSINQSQLTSFASSIASKATYNDLGYATYGGMLLIGCSTIIGQVGDIVELTMKDGKTQRCMILENEDTDEIKFYTNENWQEGNPANPTNNLKENISKIENYGNYQEGTGLVDLTNLPAIGEHTSKWTTLGDDWTVATTKVSVPDYANVVAAKGIAQNSNKSRYSDYCLAFAQVHTYDMYNGYTGDTAADAGNYKYADQYNNWFSNSKTDTLNKIYSEIVQGRPVILQVNGNKTGTSRHFVTVVGFRNSVTNPEELTEEDLLILDSYDGKIERMDQTSSRFITTGSQTGKEYSGYYLRTLKV